MEHRGRAEHPRVEKLQQRPELAKVIFHRRAGHGQAVIGLQQPARLGPLRLGEVPSGAYRPLTGEEVRALWQTTTPAARREREKAQRDQAANKAKAAGKGTDAEATIATDGKATAGNMPDDDKAKQQDRSARRGTKEGAKRVAASGSAEPVQFRLPRDRAVPSDEPRRTVIIGGDVSSFGPRRSKPPGQVRPSQVSRPPKIGAATHPLDEAAKEAEKTGTEPAKRPAKQKWLGTGRRKAGAGAGRKKGAGRTKAGGRVKRAAPPKKAGRVKRRGAGRGEPA